MLNQIDWHSWFWSRMILVMLLQKSCQHIQIVFHPSIHSSIHHWKGGWMVLFKVCTIGKWFNSCNTKGIIMQSSLSSSLLMVPHSINKMLWWQEIWDNAKNKFIMSIGDTLCCHGRLGIQVCQDSQPTLSIASEISGSNNQSKVICLLMWVDDDVMQQAHVAPMVPSRMIMLSTAEWLAIWWAGMEASLVGKGYLAG